MKRIFAPEPRQGWVLIFLFALSVSTMVLDHQQHAFEFLRGRFASWLYPVQRMAAAPYGWMRGLTEYRLTRQSLQAENKRLQEQLLAQEGRLQKLLTLERENSGLRELFHALPSQRDQFSVAEIVQVTADPFRQTLLIDKGARDGVYVGQPLLDSRGVMGKVIKTYTAESRALLLTDPTHKIPVESNRNGVRAIVMGTGFSDRLALQYVMGAVDIKEGDLMVTSGIGGGFPRGYPVGVVTYIAQETNEPFLTIRLTPSAAMDRGHQVLLLNALQNKNKIKKESKKVLLP